MSNISRQRFRPRSLFTFGLIFSVTLLAMPVWREARADQECVYLSQASAESVYGQALSTVRFLTQEALKAKRSGAWRPDGSFAQPFLNQSGRALRDIRTLLEGSSTSQSAVSRAALVEAFDQIFEVSFPRGLRHLARFQKAERRKFTAEIAELPSVMAECAG
jgi:hypothetical protein